MLILTRRIGESVIIVGDIKVTVLGVDRGHISSLAAQCVAFSREY